MLMANVMIVHACEGRVKSSWYVALTCLLTLRFLATPSAYACGGLHVLPTPQARNDRSPFSPVATGCSYNRCVIQRTAAVAVAKATAAVSRRLRLGGGTALPGLVAERIDPGVIRGLSAQLGEGSIVVTGTNGKTTTARLLRGIAKEAGLKPVANRAGSNMMRGIAAALVDAAEWSGD